MDRPLIHEIIEMSAERISLGGISDALCVSKETVKKLIEKFGKGNFRDAVTEIRDSARVPPVAATDCMPGSSGKIEELRQRHADGKTLWHDDDRADYENVTGGVMCHQ